jgi:diapolycopene oxygenase
MKKKKILIIGAGIAGLAASVRLRARGHIVEVFEANDFPGGKLTAFSEKGYRFDMGPSLFTMPQFVEDIFLSANQPIEKYFDYKKKDVVCNYFYEDGTTFSALADQQQFAEEASKTFQVDKETVLKYLKHSKTKYDLTASLFLENSLHKVSTYLSKDTLNAIFRINSLDLNTTLADYNARMFKDERLQQFYNRFATYNGSSPFQTPGIMSMIPHLEQYFGTYFPKGGMHRISVSLFELAKDIGVKFNFNANVEKILVKDKKAIGIEVGGKRIDADIVVTNSDVVPTYRKLLKNHKAPEKVLQQPRSSSALIFYWGITKVFPELDLHNIFFSKTIKWNSIIFLIKGRFIKTQRYI